MSNMEARSASAAASTTAKVKAADTQKELDGLRTMQNAIVGRIDRFEENTKRRFDAMDKRFDTLEETLAKIDQRTLDIRRAVLSRR